jgi:regulator of cell morphogenesis and NO signaling
VTDVLRNKTVDAYTTFAAFLTMDTMRIRYAMRLTSRIGEDMINAKQTIGQIARSEPAAIEVFRSQGIQYCCHGKEEIASASKTVGISAGGLLTKIYQAKEASCDSRGPWVDPILEVLILHLVRSRETMMNSDLPHIAALARSLAQCGDQVQPHAVELAMVVEALAREIGLHLAKEETWLFPLIQKIELAYVGKSVSAVPPRTFHRRVGKMVHQHEEIGHLLSAAHRLTDGYEASSSCCAPYRELCKKLKALDSEVQEEVHLENNVLFNRALQFSDALWPRAADDSALRKASRAASSCRSL